MAGRIAGITIEIGGDTTKLQKALSGTDGSIKRTQTALKDINRLLKLDPGNTELLKQKYKDLTEQIGNTKGRLETLREAARQMEGQDMTKEQRAQYEALQREIIETEQRLKSLNGEMKDFGSVGAQKIAAAGAKVEEVGGKISAVGEKLSAAGTKLLPVTGAIVGAGAAAVKSWQEVDEANDTIVKKTGATGEALEDMTQRAANLAHTIPTDFASAGEAIGEVNTRFDLQGDALEELSGKFIKFAALNDTDVTASIDGVQKAMAAWGVETENAGDYLDTLNAAAQQTGVSVLSIAASAATNAAALKELGYSASDSAVFLGNLEKNGIDTSAAMTGLKKAYAESLKEGTSLSETLGDLESRLRNQETASDAAAEAVELFGTRAGGALAEAVQTGRLSFGELGTVMSDFAGNVESTFEATLDPLDEMKTQLNQLKSAGADLVDAAGPLISDVLGKATGLIKKVTDALGKLTDKQKQTIIKTASVVAAVGPALLLGGKVVSAVGAVTQGIGKAMQLAPKIVSGVKTVGSAILGLNPAVLATVGAVAAVTAAVVGLRAAQKGRAEELYGLTEAQKEENAALAENAQAVRDAEAARQETMGGISEEYGYYQSLAGELRNITDENGNVKKGYEDRAAVITGLLSKALGIEIETTDGVIQKYGELMGTIDQVIEKKKAEAMVMANQDAYTNALQTVGDAETDYLDKVNEQAAAYEKLQQAQAAYDNYRKNFQIGKSDIFQGTQLAANLETAKQAYADVSDAVKNAADVYVNATTTIQNHEALLEASISGKGLTEAIQNMQTGFKTASNATKEQLEEQYHSFQEHYDKLQEAVANGATNVSDETLRLWAEMTTKAAVELSKGGQEGGEQYGDGVASGIDSKKGDVQTAAEGVKDATKVDLTEEGKQTGESYGAGLVQGILNYRAPVADAATGLAKLIPSNTRLTLQEKSPSRVAKGIGKYWDQGLIAGMKEQMQDVAAMSRSVAGSMITDASAMVRYPEIRAGAYTQTVSVVGAGGTDPAALRELQGLRRDMAQLSERMGRMQVRMDTGALVGTLADPMDTALGRKAAIRGRR